MKVKDKNKLAIFLSLLRNSNFQILIIILLSIFIDNLFISAIEHPPAWDQGYHLSNVFKMYNVLCYEKTNLADKWNLILDVTDSYRGPLTYFLSALFLKLFDNTYKYAYLSNQVFNIICILSIFNLGKLLKNKSTGIWGAIIFTFSSFILNQRSDYLIDLSLTAFSTLSFLFLTKWYLNKKKNTLYGALSGISLGLIFLTKPTGIIIFVLPIFFILYKVFKSKISVIYFLKESSIFCIAFAIVIFPWFSRNWLTIITSTINAWNWGVKYQEGLEFFSIESWTYYFKKLPLIFGITNFSIFSTILIIEKFFQRNLLSLKIKTFNKLDFWFLIYLFNCYLIVSLMSTKDIRFIMPIYPIICIYGATFLHSNNYKIFTNKNKKIIILISITISFLLPINKSIFKKNYKNALHKWPHEEIILEIKKENPNLVSTLAILPDTKEINTFNLEAEASKQGEYVAVRQVISNEDTYKEDLKYFDWFLLKTGDQGIMSNKSKILLNEHVLNNPSFILKKEWQLPDNSNILLFRRKILNTYLVKNDCNSNEKSLDIEVSKKWLKFNMFEKGKFIKSSNLLIDLIGKDFESSTNISLANDSFHNTFQDDSCYFLTQEIPLNLSVNIPKNLNINLRVIDKKGNIKPINKSFKTSIIEDEYSDNKIIRMTNKIYQVKLLGNYLRNGEFKNLFDLVGIINQSDPKQKYLKNAELIFSQRYNDKKNLEDIYSVLISQILQKKISDSRETIDFILESDKKNGNAHLTKAIINIFLLKNKDAKLSINNAKTFKKSPESEEILRTVEGLTNLLDFKLLNSYKLFS